MLEGINIIYILGRDFEMRLLLDLQKIQAQCVEYMHENIGIFWRKGLEISLQSSQ